MSILGNIAKEVKVAEGVKVVSQRRSSAEVSLEDLRGPSAILRSVQVGEGRRGKQSDAAAGAEMGSPLEPPGREPAPLTP